MDRNQTEAVRTEDLFKTYPQEPEPVHAVRGVSMVIESGDFVANGVLLVVVREHRYIAVERGGEQQCLTVVADPVVTVSLIVLVIGPPGSVRGRAAG